MKINFLKHARTCKEHQLNIKRKIQIKNTQEHNLFDVENLSMQG